MHDIALFGRGDRSDRRHVIRFAYRQDDPLALIGVAEPPSQCAIQARTDRRTKREASRQS